MEQAKDGERLTSNTDVQTIVGGATWASNGDRGLRRARKKRGCASWCALGQHKSVHGHVSKDAFT